ncbi:MAG TPA: hypothetical protein VKG21_08375 [Casimicrobiaceae bacterium]|nr:hypothetical protein [Casimicrobiaceae bacterium]
MNRVNAKKLGLLLFVYLIGGGLVLWMDYLCYSRINAWLVQITPSLVESGITQARADTLVGLIRNVTSEIRVFIASGLSVVLLFSIVTIFASSGKRTGEKT